MAHKRAFADGAADPSPPVFSVEGFSAGYGRQNVLEAVNLTVRCGEAVAVVGPNGAGKSTLSLAISGLLKSRRGHISGGRILLNGKDITHQASAKTLQSGIGYVPERRELCPNLTVFENLMLGGWWLPPKEATLRVTELESAFPRLKERSRQKGGSLSGGEQQLLAVARALMVRPALLILDEPSLGLAPVWIEEIYDVLRQQKAAGTSVLLFEQSTYWAAGLADQAHVMVRGKICLSGNGSDVLSREDLGDVYLTGPEAAS